jgi:DinB family
VGGGVMSGDVAPAAVLFPDLEAELAVTRRFLERVPDDRLAWRPHETSTALGPLATLVAQLPRFATVVLGTGELDFATSPVAPPVATATAERLAIFDAESGKLRVALARMTWHDAGSRWVMRDGPRVLIDGRKGEVIRRYVFSHLVHHRAQLGVYLRLLGVAIPATYGPSADEV